MHVSQSDLERKVSFVIGISICREIVVFRCKQFSDRLEQNVNNLKMNCQFAICDLSMQLLREFHFPNSRGI